MSRIRIEIVGRDRVWLSGVFVEWEDAYPTRDITREPAGTYLIEPEWLEDLTRIAADCMSTVTVAPSNPGRRTLFRRLLARDDNDHNKAA